MEPVMGQQEFYEVPANGVASIRKIQGNKMASDRGFTGESPVSILSRSQLDAGPLFQSGPDYSADTELVKEIYGRLDGNAAILLTIFRHRCETIALYQEWDLRGRRTGRCP
jgi:hypothetical protein